jgi:hypothetical protein
VRHARNADGEAVPPEGRLVATEDGPVLEARTDVYLDAPYMRLPLGLSHNLHSYPATITVRGPLEFTPDGRMRARLRNTEAVPIDVRIGAGPLRVGLDLEIPAGGLDVTYTQQPRGG